MDSVSSVLAKPGEGSSQIELPQGEDLRRNLNPNCLLHLSQVRFASPEIAWRTGIEVAPVGRSRIPQTVECYGEIEYDRTRYAVISPRDCGIVSEVFVDLGQQVREGEVLARIDSVEFGEAKAAYLRARAALNRWTWVNESYRNAGGSGAISRRDSIEARAELESASVELAIASQKLSNFGLGVDEIQEIADKNNTDTLFPVHAPFDAMVVGVNAASGERVEPGFALFQVADLSRMWVMLDLCSRDLSQVCLGQEVSFIADPAGEKTFRGEVTWIDSRLDGRTRTAKVRAELDNQDGSLRSGLFGKGSILIHDEGEATVVPRDAVQWDGCCNVCFVEQSPGRYQPRKVRLGNENQEAYTVVAGLLPGERVVTQGSYLLKTEILKGSIGAGCCGND